MWNLVEVTEEIASICSYAANLWIQAQCLEILRADNYLDRAELAVLSVLLAKEELNKWLTNEQTQCNFFNDIGDLDIRIQAYIVNSCNMWIMWLESDWTTP